MVERDWRSFECPTEQASWHALSLRASEPNPFLESWCLLPALRALDPSDDVALLCLEADGQLAGLLPVHRETSYYGHPVPHWRNWLHPNAFLGTPLVARGLERVFWLELLAWMDENAGGALFLHVERQAADGPVADALLQVLEHMSRHSATVMQEERAMLRSDLAPDAYLERALSGKKRKELRRQHRRLGEEGHLTSECLRDADGLDEWIDAFLQLERAGWKGEAGSALACDGTTETFFRDALTGAARNRRLERRALRLDGKPIAMLATFMCPPAAFAFKTAFDEDYARFSPGALLQLENIEVLKRLEIEWSDSCAAMNHPMIDQFWRERRPIVSRNIAIGGAARQLLFRLIAAVETSSGSKGSK
ncbi:MAG: GNAT family N-acetyltransferase [Porphyrobacter sp.]|nr:GNAT family N-acetyltransferase [Porphyrobacter sp.]